VDPDSAAAPASPWLGRVALALALLPLAASAVALIVGVGTSYVAGSDQGLIELRTSDVGRHAVLVGPYARDGWNHPGPALFYALAPVYRLAGGNSIGLALGALLINGLAVVGIAVVARRRGGLPLLLLTLVGCAVLMRSLGAPFLRDPWNPYVTVLPFGLLVLLTWAMTTGEAWALPVGVGVASFCVQTHVGYAPIAIPLVVWGAIWLIVSVRRRRNADDRVGDDRHDDNDQRSRDLVRASLAVAAVLVVMWLPTVIQELTASPGNLTEIAQDFADPKSQTHTLVEGYRLVSGQFELVPQWLTGHVDVDPFSGQPLLLFSAAPPVLLIPFALAALAFWRWRISGAIRLVATLLTACVAGVFAVSRVTGPAYEYRLKWTWFLATLAFVAVMWAAWMLIARRVRSARSMQVLFAVPLSALVVLGIVNTMSAVRAGEPQGNISTAVHTLDPQVLASLPERHGDVVVRTTSFEGDVYQTALVLYLESRGTAVRVDRSRQDEYGAVRVHQRNAPVRAELTIAADQEFDTTAARPGLHLVAYWGTRSPEVRADVVQHHADLVAAYEAGTISRDALRDGIASRPLGPAVGVFTASSAG